MIDAVSSELPPMRMPLLPVFVSVENDFTNLREFFSINNCVYYLDLERTTQEDGLRHLKCDIPFGCNITCSSTTRIKEICVISWIIFR